MGFGVMIVSLWLGLQEFGRDFGAAAPPSVHSGCLN